MTLFTFESTQKITDMEEDLREGQKKKYIIKLMASLTMNFNLMRKVENENFLR